MNLPFVSTYLKSAFVAYIHYLGIILCIGALLYERFFLKIDLNKKEVIKIIFADFIYGIAGVAILITGILRVKYFGQGGEFYLNNPIFWFKVSLYIIVGLFSLYPTTSYILWAIPLRNNELPIISENLVKRFKLLISTELFCFAIIPFFATLIARGIGLN